MFARLFAFIILIITLYLASVFLFPEFADQYGNVSWNEKIREMKSDMESYTGSSSSIFADLTGKASEFASGTQQFINESKQTVNQIQTTVTEKTEQVKKAADSVQNAYTAVEKAKTDIQKLGSLSGSVSASGNITTGSGK
ncbi:MAG: hypothetical protein PHY14_00195 [Candidatus Gracilibacteria bacterium]|nr:hypothetical protein [Candidatus Gracilibacteria bacterium]